MINPVVNDLPNILPGNMLLCVDDVKLISAGSQDDKLHQDLQAACQLLDSCDLPLIAVKCPHVTIEGSPNIVRGPNKGPRSDTDFHL